MKTKKQLLAGFVAAAAIVGSITLGAAPAQAACTVSNLKPHSVYNVNCSWAQHAVERAGGWAYGWRVSPCATAYSASYIDETGRYKALKSNVQVSYC